MTALTHLQIRSFVASLIRNIAYFLKGIFLRLIESNSTANDKTCFCQTISSPMKAF
jgi:hypothetical protein